jgi:hypothetical protein
VTGFLSYTYHQPIVTGQELHEKKLDGTYKGLSFSKTPEFQLFYIIPPPNKMLPPELRCHFTKLTLLQRAVDEWMAQYGAEATLPDIPPGKRSHHKKPDNSTEDINVEDINDNDQTL